MNEWHCVVCGYSHEGEGPFVECPACGVDVELPPPVPPHAGIRVEDLESDNSVALYFHEIDQIPLLTADEEVALAKRMEAGRKAQKRLTQRSAEFLDEGERACLEATMADGDRARRKLTEANSRLVVSIAKKYMGQGVPFPDLIQEGNLGLMQAVERFDYRRGCKFSTYATWWIRQAVVRALAEQGRAVRLPAHANQQMRRLRRVISRLRQELGRDPTIEEVAAQADTSPNRIRWAVETWGSPLSLEEMTFGDDETGTWGDYVGDEDLPSPGDLVLRRQLREEIKEALSGLTPREERVLELRFGLKDGYNYKLVEVAERFGLTRERVRQIEGQALEKLRHSGRSRKLREYVG